LAPMASSRCCHSLGVLSFLLCPRNLSCRNHPSRFVLRANNNNNTLKSVRRTSSTIPL
jgi:hypothetical protein